METNQVLEEMFSRYRQIKIESIATERLDKPVFLEGYFSECLKDVDGFFIDIENNEDCATLKYAPRIGISVKKLEHLCENILEKYNPKIKVYGVLTKPSQVLDETFSKYKQIGIEDIATERLDKPVCLEGYFSEYLNDVDGFFIDVENNEDCATLKYSPIIGIPVEKIESLCETIFKKYNPKIKVYGVLTKPEKDSDYREFEIHALEFELAGKKVSYPHRTFEIHGLEFELAGKKVSYPNTKLIDGEEQNSSIPYFKTDGWTEVLIDKELRMISSLVTMVDTNEDSEKIKSLAEAVNNPITSCGKKVNSIVEAYLKNQLEDETYLGFKEELQRTEAEFEFYQLFEKTRNKIERKMREESSELILEAEIGHNNIEIGL